MPLNFPKVELSKHQLVWLKGVLDAFLEGTRTSQREMLIRLHIQLPPNFDQYKIDFRLLRNGYDLSILGLWHIDPKNPLIDAVDSTIRAVKGLLIKNPSVTEIQVVAIAEEGALDKLEVARALKLIAPMGLWGSSTSSADNLISSFQVVGDRELRQFLYYKDIDNFVTEWFDKNDPQKEREQRMVGLFEDRPRNVTHVPNTAFILMSMNEKEYPELEDYCNAIKGACSSFGITARRADDFEHSDKITDLILEQIERSEFLIADLTGARPNVYYEIGYAHSAGKHPILYRKEGTQLHFDLSVHNVKEFRNASHLKEMLTIRLEEMLGRKLPVTPTGQ